MTYNVCAVPQLHHSFEIIAEGTEIQLPHYDVEDGVTVVAGDCFSVEFQVLRKSELQEGGLKGLFYLADDDRSRDDIRPDLAFDAIPAVACVRVFWQCKLIDLPAKFL